MTEEIIIDDTFCPFDEDIAREIFKKMDNRIQRLKQENEELKKNSILIPIPPQETVSIREYERLHSVLEEIKEIADKCKQCESSKENNDCGCDYLRIVRKINEVLK